MEDLVNFYKERKVLVTGCTGFKGSWLTHWLGRMGADVLGIGRPPHTDPSHYDLLKLSEAPRVLKDMRSSDLIQTLKVFQPEIVFHLAADAIVSQSFLDPAEHIHNNVFAALNLLEACRQTESARAIVMITSDKVYEDMGWPWGYRENDHLGGTDPYSTSKICIEHIIKSYREHFLPFIATARAGNVIGGGDWGVDRLIPDIVRAAAGGDPVRIRAPRATRPWQHVLEPLRGYLMLGRRLVEDGDYSLGASVFNFGPDGEMTVQEVVEMAAESWPRISYVIREYEVHPGSVATLKLDNTVAKNILGWRPAWRMDQAIRRTVEWYRDFYENKEVWTDRDIDAYEAACGRM